MRNAPVAIAVAVLCASFAISIPSFSFAAAAAAAAPAVSAPGVPARLAIPSIKLNAAIAPVGLASDGSMAVPSGKNQAGWYKGGTLPGSEGSAVLDAHVYLAFKNLSKVLPGADIYIKDRAGNTRRFIVTQAAVYKDADVPLGTLFNAGDGAHLNLITCAGTWIPSARTYDERLVVYAVLAG